MALNITGRGLDPRQDISVKLERSHLVYLQTDESPLKLEERQKLEGIIKEYLCLVPHENKYVFTETAHILHRSAATINDFSGYRACSAWTAISLYASNLLAQPWRKEYRILRTYSGYYKHEIEANLVGAELMFELMGYKHTGLGILTLDGPIDPDRVSDVSRDAIVASVECQIMKQIWETVSTLTVSWLDILDFREKNAGPPEQAIRALLHRFWERLHQNRTKLENYREFHYAQPAIINTIPPVTMPYHVIPNNCKTAIAADVDYGYMDEMNLRYFRPVESSTMNRCNTYGYLPQNNIFHGTTMHSDPYLINNSTSYVSRTQPDRLIELDATPTPVINYEKSRSRRGPTNNKNFDDTDYSRLRSIDDDYSKVERKNIKTSMSLDSAPNQSWEFVYRSLENIGYSKDVGEREDILRQKDNSRSKSSKTNHREYNDKYVGGDYHQIRSGKSRENRSEIIGDTVTVNGGELLKNKSSTDLLDLNLTNDHLDTKTSNQQDKIKKTNPTLVNQPKNYQKVVDLMKNMSIRPKDEVTRKDNRWNCFTCTFLNKSEVDICEMCGKSRRKGNEDAPLASGGKECPKCTLVNEKDASICAACEQSLKDSPTYI